MRIFIQLVFFIAFHLLNTHHLHSQVADFTVPDSICLGDTVNIINQSQNASTWYWNFSSGNLNTTPSGTNYGNPFNLIDIPTYSCLVKEGNDHFLFYTNVMSSGSGNGQLIRYYLGNSFSNLPISYTMMPNSLIHWNAEDIVIINDNNNYFGFLANGLSNNLLRFNFGTSLWNTPSVVSLGSPGVFNMPHGIVIVKENGNWIGFVTNSTGSSVTRVVWGNNLTNTPVCTNLGNIGMLSEPKAICAIKDTSSNWFLFINNYTNNSMTRLSFGNSLTNAPVGTNLGVLSGVYGPEGLTMFEDCGGYYGFIGNYAGNSNSITLISFPNGLSGSVSSTNLGNTGTLWRPSHFSDLYRDGDTLFTYLSNRAYGMGTSSYTLLKVTNTSSQTFPSSYLQNPPSLIYTNTGIYNIMLIIDEGLPTQQSVCRQVVVDSSMNVNLGPDQLICPGTQLILQATQNYDSYLWNTGQTTSSITVTQEGIYWLYVTSTGFCPAIDSISVSLASTFIINIDTTICPGQSIFAGGQLQSVSGIYYDTIPNTIGCDSVIVTNLTVLQNNLVNQNLYICQGDSVWLEGAYQTMAGVYTDSLSSVAGCDSITHTVLGIHPLPVINLPADTGFCEGSFVLLDADNPGSTYTWSNGATTQTIYIYLEGTFKITVTDIHGCTSTDSTVAIWLHGPELSVNPASATICHDSSVQLQVTGAQTYQWTPSTGLSSVVDSTVWASPPYTITYNITGSSDNGCNSDILIQIFVVEPPLPQLPDSMYLCEGETLDLDAGYCYECTYLWVNNAGTQILPVDKPGVYWVKVSQNGCSMLDTIMIKECMEIWVPNVFTPNGDGLNETFHAKGINIEKFRMLIFNRWGNQLYETADITSGWDGKYKGQLCSDGVYLYLIEYKGYKTGLQIVEKRVSGSVTLLR